MIRGRQNLAPVRINELEASWLACSDLDLQDDTASFAIRAVIECRFKWLLVVRESNVIPSVLIQEMCVKSCGDDPG